MKRSEKKIVKKTKTRRKLKIVNLQISLFYNLYIEKNFSNFVTTIKLKKLTNSLPLLYFQLFYISLSLTKKKEIEIVIIEVK